MNILTSQLPSRGYGYSFPSISVSPMSFLQITKYLENLPSKDPLERYLYDLKLLIDEDQNVLNLYLSDADFLIFYKKLCTVSGDLRYSISVKCPDCGEEINKTILFEKDIHFKAIDEKVMDGAYIELNGNKYETIVPTVKDFMKVFQVYLKYRKITDLKMIKTIALFRDFDRMGNQIESDVLGAKHEDITLLMALRDLYFDHTEPIMLTCPACGKNKKPEERREVAVSIETLIVDFFRDIYINNPVDGTKILFK